MNAKYKAVLYVLDTLAISNLAIAILRSPMRKLRGQHAAERDAGFLKGCSDAQAERAEQERIAAERGAVVDRKPWAPSCDDCVSQNGGHYCLMHSRPMKNMNLYRCGDWQQKPPDPLDTVGIKKLVRKLKREAARRKKSRLTQRCACATKGAGK